MEQLLELQKTDQTLKILGVGYQSNGERNDAAFYTKNRTLYRKYIGRQDSENKITCKHSRATVLYATSHSYRASQNSTLRSFVLPGPIVTKLGRIDYVGDPYPYANFS